MVDDELAASEEHRTASSGADPSATSWVGGGDLIACHRLDHAVTAFAVRESGRLVPLARNPVPTTRSTGPKRGAALRGFSWGAEDSWQESVVRYDEAVNGGEPLTARSGFAGSSPYTATTLGWPASCGNGLT